MRKLIPGMLLAILLAGCSGGAADQASAASTASSKESVAPSVAAAGESTQPPKNLPRKIIYSGEITLATEDIDGATKRLEAKTKELNGYIGAANVSGSKGSLREASYTIRIPSPKFDAFVAYIATLGELKTNHRSAEDVSEEYYDVDARLKNKKVEEARLIDLLKHSSGKLSDVLTLEKEISRVRQEVEQIEGRLRFLSNQTDLSTVTISMQEVKNFEPEGSPTVKTQVQRTWDGSIDALKQVGLGILLMLVALIPWLILPAILLIVIIKITRKKKPVPPPVLVEESEMPEEGQ